MADEVILLDYWPSPFGTRVKIALKEKGIDYETVAEDLPNNKSPLLLKMNPVNKVIPVLIHNGKPVCESLVIIQYIDEVWKNKSPPLLPSDPFERAHATFWAEYAYQIFGIARKMWGSEVEVQAAAKKELIHCFKTMEGELGDKPYFGGKTFGFVDIIFISYYSWFYTFETFGNFSMVAECPKLVEWAKRCAEKESVSESLPDQFKVYDVVLDRIKQFST